MKQKKSDRRVDVSNISLNELNKLVETFSGAMKNISLEQKGKEVIFSYELATPVFNLKEAE